MNIFESFIELAPITFTQSLLFSFVALGIAIPFRFLNFSDLSSEGSFPLGGAVCAGLLLGGVHPGVATLLAFFAGCGVGTFTGFLHLKFKIHSLLCGILAVTMLYSVTLRIMGKPNIALMDIVNQDLFSHPGFLISILVFVFAILFVLLRSQFGLRLRAVGANPKMAEAQGTSIFVHTLFGLAVANGLSALSGALIVQSQGYVDISMGFGILINGLAALMLGEFMVRPHSILRQILAPILGTIVFYQITSFTLCLGLESSDMKFVTGLFVLIILGIPGLKAKTALSWPAGQS